MQLSWLHPWLLVGAFGAALPIFIHLIGRRRASKVDFAAFDFLLTVNKKLARRERLRQFFLLLLRTLAILALVIALARPVPLRVGAQEQVQKRALIVLDTSASMGFVSESRPLLDYAKDHVREIVKELQPGDGISLVVAGDDIEIPFQVPTIEHSALLRHLDSVEVALGRADLGAAIDKGLQSLGEDGVGVEIFVVSDLAANSFEQVRPSGMDPLPELQLVDVLNRTTLKALSNVAIVSVQVERSPHSALDRVLKIGVRNHGSTALRRQGVELLFDDSVKQRGFIDLGPNEAREKSMTVTFDKPGVYRGVVRLASTSKEGFLSDNDFPFVLEVASGVRVLAVNGDARSVPYEDELFFLERALEALPAGESPIDLEIVDHEELISIEVQERIRTQIDVVILANVREVQPSVVDTLETFLGSGGGVLVTLGDQISFEKTNSELATILPHPIRDFHQAYDPISETRALGIGEMDWDHAVIRGLGLSFQESMNAAQTRGYFNLATGAKGKTRTLLRFDNGAPALLEGLRGPGRVLLLTTTLDLDQSNLVMRSGFPPLLQRICRYLGGATLEISGNQVQQGERFELLLPKRGLSVALVSPSGVRKEYPVAEGRRRVEIPDLLEVGIYQVEVGEADWQSQPELDIAVSPSLRESDFSPVKPSVVAAAFGGEEQEAFVSLTRSDPSSSDGFRARGYAAYFLMALGLFFIGESLLASRG